jgi:hypothetical protein
MRLVNKFVRLPAADRWLLLKSACLLIGIRVALSLFPFGSLLARISRDRTCDATPAPSGLARIVWSIETVSCHLPFARTCLTKALAAKFLLDRRGYRTTLRFGVAKGSEGQLDAHAWIERGSTIVIGGPASSLRRYRLLLHCNETQYCD